MPFLLTAACGGAAVIDPGFDLPASYAADEVVLRIETRGGLMAVEAALAELPHVTVYGDGRVITEEPPIDVYPRPVLPNVLVRTVSSESVERIAQAARDAGVGSGRDYGTPEVMDAGSTWFSLRARDGIVVSTVPALGIDNSLTRSQRRARAPLVALRDALLDLPATLGDGRVSGPRPYEPVALAAVTSPWHDPGVQGVDPPDIAWPGPALPGDPTTFAPGIGCVTVTGPQLAQVLELAAEARVTTAWTWADQRYFVWFRPLLPDESSCEDLTRNR